MKKFFKNLLQKLFKTGLLHNLVRKVECNISQQGLSSLLVLFYYICDGQVQSDRDERLNTQHLTFVYWQNELRFVSPYFILGLMLLFPSRLLSFSVTGRNGTPVQQVNLSLVPKSELHDVTRQSFCRVVKY